MRRFLLASAVLTTVMGTAALAQDPAGPPRRFTEYPIDPNRNNKVVYVPLGWAFPGPRPAQQPYDVSTATWYAEPLGIRGEKPDKVLDGAHYTLEEFSAPKPIRGEPAMIRVVISRRGGPAESVPELQIMSTQSNITVRAEPTMESISGGTRYTFIAMPPEFGFGSSGQADRYEIRFMSSRPNQKLPAGLVRRPTFGGEEPELRALQPPPQLPRTERVAGKRLEYRSARSAPQVTTDPKVAGRRQEYRK
jgi:hypothetical protein